MPRYVARGVRFQYASDQSLLISFGNKINLGTHEKIRKFLRLLELEPIPGIRNLQPAYCSVLIKFDALRLRHQRLQSLLEKYAEKLEGVILPDPKLVEIPVCYGGDFGPDLADLCALHRLTHAQAIELHTSTTYVVYFLGFVPGFAYLGELPKLLVTPRLALPRKSVPAGSVGIAGSQTGIYPIATPGGWRLIGRTPEAIFRADRGDFSLLSIGDHVRFEPISREKFAELKPA